MEGQAHRRLPGDIVGRGIGALMRWCVRHARFVVIVTVLATGVLAVGIGQTQVDQELADGLPDSNPNKRALDRVMDQLPGISTLEVVLLELDGKKAAARDVHDVRQQDAIRAEEHVWQFLAQRVPELSGGVGLHHVVKQVRVVVNNNDESFYALPPDDPLGRLEFESLWGIANNTVKPNIELTIRNPDYRSTILAIQYDAAELDSDETKRIGHELTLATAAYREAAAAGEVPPEFDIWKSEHVFNVGPQSALAKFEGHLRSELPFFVPAAFLFVFAMLWIAFRNPGTAVVGILTLIIACGATVGFLGWLHIPFTSVNIAMIPLIVGNGIDYSIHVLNEYTEERSRGKGLEETFSVVGGRAGVAMVLATTTSVAGIVSMTFAQSVMLQQLAVSATFALVTVTVLALTFIPAATALLAERVFAGFRPSRLMPAIYRTVNRRKTIALLVFAAVSAGLWVNTANLTYFDDLLESNFPHDDPLIANYVHLKERQGGSADELVIIEGDLTDPATIAYIRAIEEELMTKQPFVNSRAHVNSLTVLLGAFELLANTPNAALTLAPPFLESVIADPASGLDHLQNDDHVRNAAPTDRAAIEADIAAMQSNIAWRPLIDFLYSRDGTITIIDVLVDDGGSREFERLGEIQKMMEDAVAAHEDKRPDDVQVYVNGLSTGLYQYLDYSFQWLRILFIVSAVAGVVLMFTFTGSLRAVAAFLMPMLVTTTWFFGILPFFDIEVSILLIVPIVFITSIGSDYAAHLIWNILKTGRPSEVYRTTGKGIFYSAVTDFGAFAIFSFSYLLGVADQALATSVAILIIFTVTMLIVPLFFNREVGAPKTMDRLRRIARRPTSRA